MLLTITKEHIEAAIKRYDAGELICCCCPTAVALEEKTKQQWNIFYQGCKSGTYLESQDKEIEIKLTDLLRLEVIRFTRSQRFVAGDYKLLEIK